MSKVIFYDKADGTRFITVVRNLIALGQWAERADNLYLTRLTSGAFTQTIHANKTSNLEFRDNDASISPRNTLGAPAISPDRETPVRPATRFQQIEFFVYRR